MDTMTIIETGERIKVSPVDFDLQAEIDAARSERVAAENQLGLCFDCDEPAVLPCPDGVARCVDHALSVALAIHGQVKENRRHVHRLSPSGRKARAKRRSKRKATKR